MLNNESKIKIYLHFGKRVVQNVPANSKIKDEMKS